jgi:hypothetical protein
MRNKFFFGVVVVVAVLFFVFFVFPKVRVQGMITLPLEQSSVYAAESIHSAAVEDGGVGKVESVAVRIVGGYVSPTVLKAGYVEVVNNPILEHSGVGVVDTVIQDV